MGSGGPYPPPRLTVLMAALTSDYRAANREVGALVRACPRRNLGYAFVNPVTDAAGSASSSTTPAPGAPAGSSCTGGTGS